MEHQIQPSCARSAPLRLVMALEVHVARVVASPPSGVRRRRQRRLLSVLSRKNSLDGVRQIAEENKRQRSTLACTTVASWAPQIKFG